jgi:hypothetical protein
LRIELLESADGQIDVGLTGRTATAFINNPDEDMFPRIRMVLNPDKRAAWRLPGPLKNDVVECFGQLESST